MGYIQKILLLIVTVPVAFAPGGLVFYAVIFENDKFEATMLIALAITAIGVFSVLFHINTLKLYRLSERRLPFYKTPKILWVMSIVFGIVLLAISLFLLYYVFAANGGPSLLAIQMAIILPLFGTGVWTLLELYFLKKMVIKNKSENILTDIDSIKG